MHIFGLLHLKLLHSRQPHVYMAIVLRIVAHIDELTQPNNPNNARRSIMVRISSAFVLVALFVGNSGLAFAQSETIQEEASQGRVQVTATFGLLELAAVGISLRASEQWSFGARLNLMIPAKRSWIFDNPPAMGYAVHGTYNWNDSWLNSVTAEATMHFMAAGGARPREVGWWPPRRIEPGETWYQAPRPWAVSIHVGRTASTPGLNFVWGAGVSYGRRGSDELIAPALRVGISYGF